MLAVVAGMLFCVMSGSAAKCIIDPLQDKQVQNCLSVGQKALVTLVIIQGDMETVFS